VFEDRPPMSVDEVVLACHAPQALALLAAPTDAERGTLRHFTTTPNETWLHTDASLLPRRAAARASWNYHVETDPGAGVAVTYHMNRLQSLDVPEDYMVTLQPEGRVDESRVIRKMTYAHPLYTLESVRAQEDWRAISGRNRTHYCGAYWFNGFHEDGVRSALRVARALDAEPSSVGDLAPASAAMEVAC
jgi:predicted NAD/FAD-binding protein